MNDDAQRPRSGNLDDAPPSVAGPVTVIVGATSAMAEHAARRFAADGDRLWLAARETGRLRLMADDLRVRGAAEVEILPGFDAEKPETVERLCDAIESRGDAIDRILVAYGHLPDPEDAHGDPAAAAREIKINFTSVVRLCTRLAQRLEDEGGGTLGVIGSVAGLRGRQSNYLYGAAKGGLHVFLQGLRNRLHPAGVRVVTLLPGFVDTPMTAEQEKNPMFVSADAAGERIYRALVRRRGDVAYIPWFWRWILLAVRLVPEPLFKRLRM